MGVVSPFRNVDWSGHIQTRTNDLTTLLFGDRVGVTLFLGSLAFLALYWRIGVFITDNWTIANTMVAVADGHLYVDRIVYGPGAATPGMHIVEGRLYGRNYGHVFAALPFVWLLQGLAAVTDLRVAVVGLFSLVLLGFAVNLGALLDRPTTGALVGSVIALAAFAANIAVATPLSRRWIHLMALQVSTMVAMAFVGVVLYRLLARLYDRRVGLFAGCVVVIGTPLAFWGSIPKRHVVSALLVALVVSSFYRSRETTARETRFRALAYAWVGLLAWVHAPEALAVFVALAVVDVPTARSNDARTLAVVAGAFLLSLLPFFITNQLIAGNPIEPPRLLSPYGGGEQGILSGGDGGGFGGGGGGGGSGGGTGSGASQLIPPALSTLVWDTFGKFALFVSLFTRGIDIALTEPDRLYHTFVHSGYISRIAEADGQEAINLGLLESMPLLAALVALPAVAARKARDTSAVRTWLASPVGQTDLLVGASTLLLTLVYLPRLPVHAMVTARYLLPIIPPLLYLLLRVPPVRTAIRNAGLAGAFGYGATVLIGGQLLVIVLFLVRMSLGEAIQLHAWIGLATALPLGVWVVVATIADRDYARIGAILLGVAAGATTVFLVLSGLVYFSYAGTFALPMSQRISELLSVLG